MKTRLYIATSEGPSEIQSLIKEDPDVACAICLNGSTESLPITRGYNAFVRKPTGVIERMTGHKSYRLDVSHPITNGESWQLGIYLAHALAQQNMLATHGEEAERVWLVTGAVSARDETVQSVSHIQQKMDLAHEMLNMAKLAGRQTAFILPRVDREKIRNDHSIDIIAVETAQEALNISPLKKASFATKKLALTLACCILIAGAIWGQSAGIFDDDKRQKENNITTSMTPLPQKPEDVKTLEVSPPKPEPAAEKIKPAIENSKPVDPLQNILITVGQLIAADGKSCAGRAFREVDLTAKILALPFKEGVQDDPLLCGLRLSFKNDSKSTINPTVTISSQQQDLFKSKETQNSSEKMTLTPPQKHTEDLVFSLYRAGDYQIDLSLTLEGTSYRRDESLMIRAPSNAKDAVKKFN